MILHDLFDWTNATVGGAGLLLTIAAVWQAHGAKRAAIEARDRISRRNASDEIARIERLASRMQAALQSGQKELFFHIAHEFIAECSRTRERYRHLLIEDAGDRLDSVATTVLGATRAIHRGARLRDYIDIVEEVVRDINGIEGWLSQWMDEEGQ
jgi:hypothetical protein